MKRLFFLLLIGGVLVTTLAQAASIDLFGSDKFIKNPIFSDFALDQQGNVDFTLTFSVDKSLVLYESFLERQESLGGLGENLNQPLEGEGQPLPGAAQDMPQNPNNTGNGATNPFLPSNPPVNQPNTQ